MPPLGVIAVPSAFPDCWDNVPTSSKLRPGWDRRSRLSSGRSLAAPTKPMLHRSETRPSFVHVAEPRTSAWQMWWGCLRLKLWLVGFPWRSPHTNFHREWAQALTAPADRFNHDSNAENRQTLKKGDTKLETMRSLQGSRKDNCAGQKLELSQRSLPGTCPHVDCDTS